MTPNQHNTRALSHGDTLTAQDFIVIPQTDEKTLPEMLPVDEREVGNVVNGDEGYEYRRWTMRDPIDVIADEYSIDTGMGREALRIALGNLRLFDRKQRDYGSDNISAFGEFGVLVRMTDKMARLKNLLGAVGAVKDESIEDTLIDLSNYAIIALLVRRKLWK